MSRMLLERREVGVTSKRDGRSRLVWFAVAGGAGLMLLALLAVPAIIGSNMFFASTAGCSGQKTGTVGQPAASAHAGTIPADYLHWYQVVGQQYNVPWPVLAGIGTVESDNGRSTLPGVHSGANPFGAAGPMQIGIGGAAGNAWGGAPVHPDSVVTGGVATDEDGLGVASVYDPADAIAGAAKYLVRAGVQTDVSAAIFAYNHLQSYVQSVLYWAGVYAGGKFGVVQASTYVAGCGAGGPSFTVNAPNQVVATAIAFAEGQLGKPYLWGGTGPDAFDCSGLVMMAYRAAGVDIQRTSQMQWLSGPRVPAASVEPGDLVFFAGSDGTRQSPGHVGLVIGNGQMIEAFAQGVPIRISSYAGRDPVGFTRPWASVASTAASAGSASASAASASFSSPAP